MADGSRCDACSANRNRTASAASGRGRRPGSRSRDLPTGCENGRLSFRLLLPFINATICQLPKNPSTRSNLSVLAGSMLSKPAQWTWRTLSKRGEHVKHEFLPTFQHGKNVMSRRIESVRSINSLLKVGTSTLMQTIQSIRSSPQCLLKATTSSPSTYQPSQPPTKIHRIHHTCQLSACLTSSRSSKTKSITTASTPTRLTTRVLRSSNTTST